MSWFGLGGGGSDDKSSSSYESTSSYPESSFDNSASQSFDNSASQSFPQQQQSYAPSVGGGAGDIQQELMMAQQQAMVKQVMFKLTDTSFNKCVSKPSSSLSSSESSCIKATVNKYLEASEYLVGKMSQQQRM
eukprot:CAMPEP_0114466724 /NCGR_PEP_ID=MMETSP0104-20121206/9230_1 /TAXON_ID=37642 ORGANISM="Paraphysomonas imperforata, Strain PA2" /NCGR_SAMPLE_ID=MMETSP0104 /ASSEMBLY_ACC=CAM_ASM_000202 /LENGTH=132 /DNA_ID=CAMNT_0001640119 /DNA_START=53 /DNA_END=451 /DNA_ORIENTATION=+